LWEAAHENAQISTDNFRHGRLKYP
jgi:hypothetical protein